MALLMAVGVAGIIIATGLYFYFKQEISILLIPIFGFVFLILNNLFNLLQTISQVEHVALLYGSLSQIALSLFLSIVVWFILSFEGDENPLKIAFSCSIPFALMVILAFELQFDINLMIVVKPIGSFYLAEWSLPVGILLVTQAIITGYWFYSGLTRIKNYVVDPEQDRQIRRMQLGIIFSFLVAPLFRIATDIMLFTFGDYVFNPVWVWIIGSAMIFLGSFLTIFGYYSGRRVEFLQPQKQHNINRYMNFLFQPVPS